MQEQLVMQILLFLFVVVSNVLFMIFVERKYNKQIRTRDTYIMLLERRLSELESDIRIDSM